MSVTSWKSPGTIVNADRGGRPAWTGPTNAAASDDSRALYTTATSGYSDWLQCTNFGFDGEIPSNATIKGIEVEIERSESHHTVNAVDSAIFLRKGGAQTGNNKADTLTEWPLTDAYAAYGGDGDLWGSSFLRSEVIATDFGVDISAYIEGNIFSYDARIDHVRIRVYYELLVGYHMII